MCSLLPADMLILVPLKHSVKYPYSASGSIIITSSSVFNNTFTISVYDVINNTVDIVNHVAKNDANIDKYYLVGLSF